MGAAATVLRLRGYVCAGQHPGDDSPHRVQSVSSAVHNVAERWKSCCLMGHAAFLIATNVDHRTLEGWRLVADHASTGGSPEGISGTETSQLLDRADVARAARRFCNLYKKWL